ncbi:hypothetical protein GGR55DRAFT_682674 [Xylaria sp. FL0064]|nr:hypothetical protein GGR55DRAFT_682674 [Xylaria sp. FL0064]
MPHSNVKKRARFDIPATGEAQQVSPQHSFSTTDNFPWIREMLPASLYGALETSDSRDGSVAFLGMFYENTDSDQLTLKVKSGSLDHLTMAIFGDVLHMSTNDKTRCIQSKGVQVWTEGMTQIIGGDIAWIEMCFGQQLGEGIRAGPLCKMDEMGVYGHTKAVSMRIPSDVSEPGAVVLDLGEAPSRSRKSPWYLALDQLDPNVSVDDNALPTPVWIVGKNQRLSWRDCFIRVYTNENQWNALESYEICSGQCTVPEGKELFFGGDGGYVFTRGGSGG